jgi:hypothetical protein
VKLINKDMSYNNPLFERKGDILHYKGEQIILKLLCSAIDEKKMYRAWDDYIKFPYKKTNINGNLDGVYLALLEKADEILELECGQSMYSQTFLDNKNSCMVITRL